MVIVGFAGGDRGTRGRVKAYDAKDGRLIWTFYTIPGPGEPGHETWPKDNDAWKYGGAAIWQTPAVDPELGLVYFSTGNAAPGLQRRLPRRRQPVCRVDAGDRAGDRQISLALPAGASRHLGLRRRQSRRALMDVRMGGRARKAIAEVGKTGWAYILDRETGKPLIGIDEKPVPQEPRQATAATQPFPRGDAIVPQLIEIAPEGHALVNDGRIFTPFVGSEPDDRRARDLGRRELAAELVRSRAAAAVRLRLVGDQRLHRRRRCEVRDADRRRRLSRRRDDVHARARAPASSRRST